MNNKKAIMKHLDKLQFLGLFELQYHAAKIGGRSWRKHVLPAAAINTLIYMVSVLRLQGWTEKKSPTSTACRAAVRQTAQLPSNATP